ncbi:hypothetical protein [Phenylobacterium sp.]|uniref:hypothetical protein n=1 Tax=Phenylobacterium sp. TaxID=1871053 RepID=UPI0027376E5C|nr:hypothetical protein [Phenylobacterium sp.]MDP3659069.1 hypothetical protein [Phenylobacterium sp.]
MRKTITLAATAFALSLAAGQADAETFPVKLTPTFAQLFKGHTKVGIPTYHLNFVTSQQATAVAGIGARTRLAMVLAGVDETTMRRLADEAYADLRKQFEAAGIPVLSAEETAALVDGAGMERIPGNVDKGGGGPGITIGKSLKRGYVTYGPSAAPALAAYRTMGSPLGVTGFASIGTGKMAMPAWNLDANLVSPSLTIDFAQMEASTGSDFLGRAKASTSGNVAFIIRQGSTVSILNPMNKGYGAAPGAMRPDKDVISDEVFATLEEGGAPVRVGSMTAIADDNYQMVARARGDAVVVNLPVWEGLVRDAYRDYNAAIVSVAVKIMKG